MSRAAIGFAALCGAALAWGGVLTGERLRLEAGPPGWSVAHPDVPLRLARLSGPPRLPGQGWPLDGHGILARDTTAPAALQVEASLPEGGRLELRLGGPEQGGGVSLVVSRVGEGLAQVATADSEAVAPMGPASPRQWLSCEGELPVPGPGVTTLGLAVVDGGVQARVGDATVRCAAGSVGPRVGVRSGLRRVGLHALKVDGGEQRAPGPAWPLRLLGGVLGAGLGAGLVLGGRRLGVRPALVALALLPGLLAPWMASSDLAAGLQAARIVTDQPLAWGVGLPSWLSLHLVVLVLVGKLSRRDAPPRRRHLAAGLLVVALPAIAAFGPAGLLALPLFALLSIGLRRICALVGPAADNAVLGALAMAAVTGSAAGILDPSFPVAVPLAQGAGLLLGLLVWVNVRAAEIRAFNLLSLAAMLGALAFAEQALTWSATGMSLVGISSRAEGAPLPGAADDLGTAFRSFEALEHTRQWQRYPIQDYPVQPPARSAPLRIAALGSSSTAGAYQNDDIDEFWPADLDRLLGTQVQVINQGVGGWTSLHARRYVQTRQDVVDADILVVYLGHNDLLTESPRPYAELHAAWLRGDSTATAISAVLGELRLYQLLRFGLQGALGIGTEPAVPDEDARANYAAMAEVLAERDGKLLLVLEASVPDPSILASHGDAMAALAAERDDVAYLDAAAVLADPRRSGLFLDDCHLTRRGHVLLAETIAVELEGLGWVR